MTSHLSELRKRLINVLIFNSFIFLICFFARNYLYEMLSSPLIALLPNNSNVISTDITSTFMIPMQLSFQFSCYMSMPFLLFQFWSFIAPGLYPFERISLKIIIILSSILFYVGSLFSYFIIIPLALKFFVETAPNNVLVMADINHYLTFITTLMFAGGISFQIPVATLVLRFTGIYSTSQLKSCRRYVAVFSFTAAMFLTPPDVISQILLAIPMILLFEIGILLDFKAFQSKSTI